jgi:acyl carrier protein
MNRFRYDVCLHVDHPPASEPEHGMLELNGSNGTAWREEIKTNRPLAACVEGISNARTADAAAISAWLEDPYADPDLAVALAQLETSAFHPDDLIEWGEQLGYRVELFETPGAPGKMDAVLIGPECDADPAQLLPATRMDEMTPPDSPEISERSTDPLRPLRRRLLSEALRTTVRNTLPTHMHPSGYTFLDSLPRTPSGKLDHAALAMMEDSDAATLEAVNPVTPLESGLLEIWKDVLNIPHCGTTDSFFDLGGHSLSALQLISRIRSSYGVEYPLTVLFDSSSVQSAAKWIEPLLVQGDGAANDGAGIPETDAIRPAEEISVDELSDEEVEAMLLARLKQASDD